MQISIKSKDADILFDDCPGLLFNKDKNIVKLQFKEECPYQKEQTDSRFPCPANVFFYDFLQVKYEIIDLCHFLF